MIHQKLVVPLTAVVMTGVGWMLNDLFHSRSFGGGGVVAAETAPSSRTKAAGGIDPVFSAAGRKRSAGSPTPSPEQRRIHMNVDGSVTISPGMVRRLAINVLSSEGQVNREELALLGVDAEKADSLQAMADKAWNDEIARQTRRSKVVRDGEDGSTILIPSGEKGGISVEEGRRQLEEQVRGILGTESKLAADSFISGMYHIARAWSDEILVVDTRLNRQGKREYKVYSFRHGFTPQLDGVIDPVSLADRSFGQRTYRAEEIPEELKHLFK